jgi:hypothetical protein
LLAENRGDKPDPEDWAALIDEKVTSEGEDIGGFAWPHMTFIVLPLIESDPDFAEEFAKTFDNPDIKENFRRKARYVAGGHQTDTPKTMTYSSVVSRDSVRIALVAAALDNDVLFSRFKGLG